MSILINVLAVIGVCAIVAVVVIGVVIWELERGCKYDGFVPKVVGAHYVCPNTGEKVSPKNYFYGVNNISGICESCGNVNSGTVTHAIKTPLIAYQRRDDP